MEIGELGERKLIDKIWEFIGEENENEDVHFLDVGKKYILLAMDTINEGFHFEKWWDPTLIGKFLVDINLSDVVSKNGKPLEMMVSFSFPRKLEVNWVKALVKGISDELKRYDMKFSGGDLKESKKISLTGLVIGEVKKGEEFRRSGAREGDYVYISSKIGRNERAIMDYHRGKMEKYREILDILPRIDILKSLKEFKITSCVDNSDGIYKSLSIFSSMSGVKIKIESDVSTDSKSEKERIALFSIGGDYELIFTSPDELPDFPRVGKVLRGKGVVDLNGSTKIPPGFDHFKNLNSKSM